jgi:hypothetical protein
MRGFLTILACAGLWCVTCCRSSDGQEITSNAHGQLEMKQAGSVEKSRPRRMPTPPTNSHPFRRSLYGQIGSAWYRSTQANLDKIAVGKIGIGVTLSPEGKITQLDVLSNTSNKLLEKISLSAIREAQIPPVPPELLIHGKYHDDLFFTIYPNGEEPKPTESSAKPNRPNQTMQPTASPGTAPVSK